jgi:hypothetical protein
MTEIRRPRAKTDSIEDTELVRAAQHMIETHGARSADIAADRADRAQEREVKRRWQKIAYTIRGLGSQ